MNKSRISLAIVLLASMFAFSVGAQAGWQDFLKEQLDTFSGDDKGSDQLASVLSNDEVIAGLKQALEKGADYAVQSLGKADGFLGNSAVKISMPDKMQVVEDTLRKLGQDKYADEFVTTMNRAAEQAVPLTLDILKKGVADMSFDDARSILKGPDDAATSYLRKVGGAEMTQKISPIVADMTARTGVTSQYKQLFGKLGFLNSVMDPDDYDIDKYVTAKTVDGLFYMISVEEKKIRENPLERTTDLLKKVFAN